MTLTRSERKKVRDLDEFSKLARVDYWNVDDIEEREARAVYLAMARDHMVRITVLSKYVLFDELLTNVMCSQFFPRKKTIAALWRTKQFQTFNYYIVEELSLMKKLALVKSWRSVPKSIQETIRLTNVLRNAVAHSFFPTNKREFKRTKKVTYKGKDIYTVEGLRLFNDDGHEAIDYLFALVYGRKLAELARGLEF